MRISKTAFFIFLLLTFIWGTSFILIKKSLIVFSPVQLGSLRILITFIALFPFSFKYMKRIRKKDWFILGISGLIGSFFPAYLFAFAQEGINSSTAGILNSLTPLFALLIGVLFFQFQAKWWNYLGIVITFIGTYGLLSISGGQEFSFNFKYSIYIIIAAIGYGIQVNIIKYILHHIPSFTILVAQYFIIGGLSAIVLFVFTDYLQMISFEPDFIIGMFYVSVLAIVATAFALVLFYRLIKLVDPVFSSSVTYFIPAIAVLWGIFDGETINFSFFLWVTIILLGVFFVNSKNLIFLKPKQKD